MCYVQYVSPVYGGAWLHTGGGAIVVNVSDSGSDALVGAVEADVTKLIDEVNVTGKIAKDGTTAAILAAAPPDGLPSLRFSERSLPVLYRYPEGLLHGEVREGDIIASGYWYR